MMSAKHFRTIAALGVLAVAACRSETTPAAPVPVTTTRYTLTSALGAPLPALQESFTDSTLSGVRTVHIRVTSGELVVDRATGLYTLAIERKGWRVDTIGGQPVETLVHTWTSRDRGRVTDGSAPASMVLQSELFSGLVHPAVLGVGQLTASIREPGTDDVIATVFKPQS